MTYSYNKTWKLLIDRGLKKKDLIVKAGLSSSTIAKMTNNKPVNLTVLARICEILDCQVGDLVEVIF